MDATGISENSSNHALANHRFIMPEKKIRIPADMQKWTKSMAYNDYLGFIMSLNKAVKGKKCSDNYPVSQNVEKLSELLNTLSTWVDEIQPIEQPQRFGNKAFREWHSRLEKEGSHLTSIVLPENLQHASDEVSDYLINGFGNNTRIDYGTGHEAAFAAFLCCLFKLQVLTEEDQVAVVLKTFKEYLNLARKLQRVYKMEPAGSQGVWGLDDYQFLPFIWGSSQLIANSYIFPKSFVDNEIIKKYHEDYLFLQCIKYINEVKTGPFAEHSNTLWGISAVPHWGKVNSGSIKMYKAEVLQKFPVIQHFNFGSILSIDMYTP